MRFSSALSTASLLLISLLSEHAVARIVPNRRATLDTRQNVSAVLGQ